MLDPGPPHEPRWLDLTAIPGEPAARIDLARPPDTATVTAGAATASPASTCCTPSRRGCSRREPSRLSSDPGQLGALCARLNADGHGITEPLARDLPEPWLSILARYQRSTARAAPARDGCAPAAAVFADLDGVTLAILGLHNCQGRTVMPMHASGPICQLDGHPDDPWSDHPDELYRWPVTWIRDSGGRSHTTRIRSRSEMNDQVGPRLEATPPQSRATAWIEPLAAGHPAQARATLLLRWP